MEDGDLLDLVLAVVIGINELPYELFVRVVPVESNCSTRIRNVTGIRRSKLTPAVTPCSAHRMG